MSSNLKSNWTLEDEGIPGPNFLRESLTSCTDPLKAIEEFQLQNGILLPSLRPMLPLLDLHGIRRLDFHNSVLENLREKLIGHINEIGQKKINDDKNKDKSKQRDQNEEKKLQELLLKSFQLIRIKSLRPVIMCILKNLPQIEDSYLKTLVRDKDLYNDIDTEVKRQIWKDNQSLFGDEVSPLLSKYIWDKENILHDHLNLTNQFFSLSPKIRRQSEVVQKLAHMIGTSVKLYDMVLQFLRTLFLRTRNVHYCTLRSELLMAYHDLEIQEIFSVDPCHKFTWCLDACIREKNVDVKKSKELQGFLDSIHKGHEQIIAEISMTLCDPFAINFLANYIIKILQHMINSDALPRENPTLVLLLRMLSLGLSAWKIIGSRDFREQKLDVHLITKFMPALMSLMVDDQVRQLHAKLPPDERESAITVIEHSGPLPETCEFFVKESPIASLLIMYYTLNVVRQKDRTGILRIVPILSTCTDLHSFEDPYLHSLVIGLIALQDEFTNDEFCTAIFDEFFFVCLNHSNVIKHMLKLLWYVHHKLPGNRLEMLMKTLEPGNQHNEMTHKLYRNLQEKITEHTNEPSPNNSMLEDDFNSPLMNVPTPAPLYQ